MSKSIQTIDELFRSALSAHEENPSDSVLKHIIAGLDKKDAETYKKKSSGWKRVAIILIMLVAGFMLYESGLFDHSVNTHYTNRPDAEKEMQQPRKNITVHNPKNAIDGHTGKKERLMRNGSTFKKSNQNKGEESLQPATSFNGNGYKREAAKNISAATTVTKKAGFTQSRRIVPGQNASLIKNNAGTKGTIRIPLFKPYWSITGVTTYERVNYKLDSDQPNAITSLKHREVHEPSFSTGVLVSRQVTEHWALQSGLIFSQTAVGINSQKLYALQDPSGDIAYKYTGSAGYAYIKPGFGASPAFGDSIISTEAKHTLQALRMPFMIKYAPGRNKFQLILGAGLEGNLITNSKLEIELEDANHYEVVHIKKLQGAKSFYWSLMTDVDFRYNINSRFAFGLRPVFRYAISPITENNLVETFPYSLGLSMGITYRF